MNESRADISVIVRTAGRPRCYLDRALASVRAQTVAPACVIISDDGAASGAPSSPAVGDLPALWLTRNSATPPNRSAALNRAIAQTRTAWLAFLDDDDTWAPGFLEQLHGAAEISGDGSDFGAMCCRTEAIYEEEHNGSFVGLGREPFNPGLRELTGPGLARRNRFTNNAVLWHHRVFTELGGYREDLPVLEDWEFNVRAAARFRMTVLSATLAYYHQRPLEISRVTANSPAGVHDQFRRQLASEWRLAGLLPADTGWNWVINRWNEWHHQVARRRFRSRWKRA